MQQDREQKERLAKRKHDQKRASLPQFPKQYIDIEYEQKINKLLEIFKTKKAVLLAGIDELINKHKDDLSTKS